MTPTEANDTHVSMDMHALTPTFAVSPQLTLADLAEAKAAGVTLVVNNRPDGEDPAAPSAADMETEARRLGLAYIHLPVAPGQFDAGQLPALNDALAAHPGKALAFCRSGTRSTHLWALVRAQAGDDPGELIAAAARGGYDLAPLAATLNIIATQRTPSGR